MKEFEIEDSLIDTIGKSGGYSILKDGAEFGLDSLLTEGPLKQIPVVGVLCSIAKGAVGVREYLLFKKLIKFITALKDNSAEIEAYIAVVEKSPKEKRKLADRLFLALDKLGDIEKSDYVAKAFCALASGRIDMNMFLRFLDMIERSFFPDLVILQKNPRCIGLPQETMESLANSGIMSIQVMTGYDGSSEGYVVSKLGEKFIINVLQKAE